jgi:putative FmdB family regulatory protein
MPIFEYVCNRCDHRFEKLVFGNAKVECPSCKGRKLEKQLSVFSANGKGASYAERNSAPAPCGSCGDPRGPGACSMN